MQITQKVSLTIANLFF
jgi:predicted  nucleic acid-binding Zn-ribbon protein